MKLSRNLISVLMVGLAATAALESPVTTAQVTTSGNGPYYATPSWDQKITIGRFVVLTNWNSEAVLDRETGLVWDKEPATSGFNWAGASIHCVQRTVGGRKGWRLPSIQELASLVDPTQSNPMLPSGHPFDVQASPYWSSSTFVGDATLAFIQFISSGTQFAANKTANTNIPAWCVRGGSGVDP